MWTSKRLEVPQLSATSEESILTSERNQRGCKEMKSYI